VIGAPLSLTARVDLGGLGPDDVTVQAVLGRVTPEDELTDTSTVTMSCSGVASAESALTVFTVETPLPRSGAVGYTVRVLPAHDLLATPAELGRVVNA
jgi:starch phosphorylase